VPNAIRADLIRRLKAIPRAKKILDRIKAKLGNYKFTLKWSSSGTYVTGKQVFLATKSTKAGWIGDLAHELYHLASNLEGKEPDPKKLGRAQYVKKQMDEEIGSQAACYIALMQIGDKKGVNQAGYKDWLKYVKKSHTALQRTKKWAKLEQLAIKWVTKKYKTKWVTNNTSENYYTYWGKYWDKVRGRASP